MEVLTNSAPRLVTMTKETRRPSAFVLAMIIVGIVGIVTGAFIERGVTATVIPVILGAAVIFGVIWIGGFKLGAAFANFLKKRWYE
jgi:VIT1/CCC1 family predicted Fe2+/Mn2+ transporter